VPDDDKTHFPRKYDQNYLYLLEVDPSHIHAFWEIIPDCIPDQILKTYPNNNDLWLKIYCNFHNRYSLCIDLNVKGLINDWFIELASPLAKCHAELGYNDPRKRKFISLCRSNNLDVFPEKEFSDYSIEKNNQGNANSDLYQEKPEDTNPFLVDPEKDKKTHPMELITEKDIKDYYRLLSERRIFNPGFSPWRLILEKMKSSEALRVLKPSGPINIYREHSSSFEINSSYWSAVSSYSSFFKIDKDK
jgi:hypothetical protein